MRSSRFEGVSRRLFGAGILAAAGCSAAGADQAARAAPGQADRFVMRAWSGPPLPVWTYRPGGAGSATPLVLVMHGQGRNASQYRDYWIEPAERFGFAVAAPEFSRRDFPEAAHYNLGDMRDGSGRLRPQETWAFSAIAPVFEEARLSLGLEAEAFALFGHSAGAQFVHRFLLFLPEPRVSVAVVANAGWYTMPDPGVSFPFGLEGAGVSQAQLAAWLARPLTVLLGTRDVEQTGSLLQTPAAMAQGEHRLARGGRFFAGGLSQAERLGASFNWRLGFAPGVGHEAERMAMPGAYACMAGVGATSSGGV